MLDILSDPRWSGLAAIAGILSVGLAVRQYRQRQKIIASEPPSITPGELEILSLAHRFLSLFKGHQIEPAQIPRYIPELSLADLASDEKLVGALNPTIMGDVCQHFNISSDWLEGKGVSIYNRLTFYKNLKAFVDFFIKIKSKHKELCLYAVKCREDKLNENSRDELPIVLLFEASVDGWEQNSGEPIWAYYVINDHYWWGYNVARYHIKAITYIAATMRVHTFGCQLNKDDIDQILTGNVFPGSLLAGVSHVAWYPDDYICTNEESAVAKDHDEALKLRGWLDQNGVLSYLANHSGRTLSDM